MAVVGAMTQIGWCKMIKVIQHGMCHRIARCPKCGCRFEYSADDVRKVLLEDWLKCPECGNSDTEGKYNE